MITTYVPDPNKVDGKPVVGDSTGSGGLAGAGSPEGVTTATPGTTYLDTVANAFYVKATGSGNTGWIPLIA
jgi:hypothetical protein